MASSSHALSVAQHEAAEAMRALQRAHDRVERHSRLMMPPRATRPSSEPLYANEEGLTLKAVGQHLSSVAEGEEDGRTLFSHLRPPWDERITWYKGPRERPYSRRELYADTVAHAIGIVLAIAANVGLVSRLLTYRPPLVIAGCVLLYGFSIIAMISLSAIFNIGQAYWGHRRPALRSADHAGICLMIAGTNTPFMATVCTMNELAFVWSVGLLAILARASRGCCDVALVHVSAFLMMGWSCLSVWTQIEQAFSPWACRMLLTGGSLYTIGLIPWLMKPVEFHISVWHAFVIVAGACFYSIVYVEIATLQQVPCSFRVEEAVRSREYDGGMAALQHVDPGITSSIQI